MHWTYAGQVFAEINPEKAFRLRGRKASGRYRMRLEISPLIQARTADSQVRLVWLAGNLLARLGGDVCLLSLAESCSLTTATTAYSDAQVVLGADLSYRQINALNEARNPDGSLSLQLDIWGLASGNKGIERIYGTDQLTIGNEQWQQFLADCDFAEIVLIEVLAPKPQTESTLVGAVRALADARTKLLLEKRPSEAVGECRHVLDAIKAIPPLPLGVEVRCTDGRKLDQLTFQERVGLLTYALRHATQPPHHEKLTEIPESDARMIVAMAAILLARTTEERRRATA